MVDLQLNPHVAALKPSATMAMAKRARDLKAAGQSIVSLSAGEPDFDTPAPIVEAAAQAMREGWTRYTDNAGLPDLRAAIADKLRRENGLAAEPAQVIVSNGAKQSVAQAILAITRPGDEVISIAPYWVSYPEMVELAGGTTVVVEATAADAYKVRPEALEAAITPRTRLVLLNSPNNPTGAVYTRAELEAIADVLRRHEHVYVLSDEIYEYVVYGVEHVSIGALDGMAERTITVNGFSKGYAMTGWRLGYLVAAPAIAKACDTIQSQTTSAPSTISQKAGLAALSMDRSHIDTMVEAFRARRDRFAARLAALPGVTLPVPDGAFYLFPDVRGLYGRSVEGRVVESAEEFGFLLLERYGVAGVPGAAFGAPDAIRFSYASSVEELDTAADRIERCVTDLMASSPAD